MAYETGITLKNTAFGVAIEVEALFKNTENKNKDNANKDSRVDEIAKKATAEIEALKKQQIKESAKLTFALAKIKNLKSEVCSSQSEVASMTKRMETSDAHHILARNAREKANKEYCFEL